MCLICVITVAIGVAYVVMGNAAGRYVGGMILATVGLYLRNTIRRNFTNTPGSQRSRGA